MLGHEEEGWHSKRPVEPLQEPHKQCACLVRTKITLFLPSLWLSAGCKVERETTSRKILGNSFLQEPCHPSLPQMGMSPYHSIACSAIGCATCWFWQTTSSYPVEHIESHQADRRRRWIFLFAVPLCPFFKISLRNECFTKEMPPCHISSS